MFDVTIVIQSFLYRTTPEHLRRSHSHSRSRSRGGLSKRNSRARTHGGSVDEQVAEEEALLGGDSVASLEEMGRETGEEAEWARASARRRKDASEVEEREVPLA